jgi:hypothetical protein
MMMTNSILTMAGERVKPGTKKIILYAAPNLYTQAKIDVPVHVFHGKNAGKKIFILAGIHGDELNGIEIIRRIHEHINVKRLSGTIITVPVVNAHGVMMQTRYLSDRRDLNRSFPGKKSGTLAARVAYTVMHEVVKHCDYGIDLHTGAVGRINMPQLRVDFSVPGSKEFALSFAAPVILDSRQRDGSLREAASRLGIPVIVYEGGEALRFNELCIRGGVRGILDVLKHLKMLNADKTPQHPHTKAVITNTSRWLRAPASGLVEPIGELIARPVKKNQVIAHIHDPFLINPSCKVIAPFDGIVIGQALRAMTTEGDALFHVASFKKLTGVRAYLDEYRDDISD